MNKLRHRMDLAKRFSEANAQTYMYGFLDEQLKTLDRIIAGQDYLACTFYVPAEIIALFDVNVVYIERMAGFGAANLLFSDLYAMQMKHNLPLKCCSYQIFFLTMLAEGILPYPNNLVAARYACDDAWISFRLLAKRKSIPFYLIDVLKSADKRNTEYIARQIKELYDELKSNNHQMMSIDDVVDISNCTLSIKSEIDFLRKKYPGIIESLECLKIFTLYNDLGRKATYNIYESLLALINSRIQSYDGCPGYRVLFLGVIPLYNNKILIDIEKRYQCRFVFEELSDYGKQQLEAENFFLNLAQRIVNSFFFSVEERLSSILKYCEQMGIDGIINFSQHNCDFLPPTVSMLRKGIIESGVAFVDIEVDAINSLNFNVSKCWDKLDVFFEQIRFMHKQSADMASKG